MPGRAETGLWSGLPADVPPPEIDNLKLRSEVDDPIQPCRDWFAM
jgi:hypothetical protein